MQNTTSNIAITDPLQSTSTPPPLEQQQPSPTHSLNIADIPIRTTPRRAILSYQAQRAKADIMELREEIGGLERMLEEVRFGGRKTGIGLLEKATSDFQNPPTIAEILEGTSINKEEMGKEKQSFEPDGDSQESRKQIHSSQNVGGRVSGATVWDREIESMNAFLRKGREHILEEMVGKQQKREIGRRIRGLGLGRGETNRRVAGNRDGERVVEVTAALDQREIKVSAEDAGKAAIEEDDDRQEGENDWESVYVLNRGDSESIICIREMEEAISDDDGFCPDSPKKPMEEMEDSSEDEGGIGYGSGEIETVERLESATLHSDDLEMVRRDYKSYTSGELRDNLVDSTVLMDIEEDEKEILLG